MQSSVCVMYRSLQFSLNSTCDFVMSGRIVTKNLNSYQKTTLSTNLRRPFPKFKINNKEVLLDCF